MSGDILGLVINFVLRLMWCAAIVAIVISLLAIIISIYGQMQMRKQKQEHVQFPNPLAGGTEMGES